MRASMISGSERVITFFFYKVQMFWHMNFIYPSNAKGEPKLVFKKNIAEDLLNYISITLLNDAQKILSK